jgi:hypothetical protein
MAIKRYNLEDEQFLQQFVVPEEDRYRFTTAPWTGEYRWFRSANIVPLEHYRRNGAEEGVRPKAA